ncbi:MAG: GntR family transcriptional regulator [Synergistaceae bacterium]|nr:GntR family transcriptional regulator [Synergistaceae bacterium]
MMQRSRIYNTSSDFVYLDLRGKIVSKELKPSHRLLEVKIATEMGVSRTPVREALRRLANEGLVKIVPNSGARVAAPTVNEMENAYLYIIMCANILKASAWSSPAATVWTAVCLNGWKRCCAPRRAPLKIRISTPFFFLEANNTFHRLIAESGKNNVFCEYIDNIMLRTNVYIFFYFYDQFDEKDNYSSQEHRAILRAIAQRDKERAQEHMREHLHHSHRVLEVPDSRKKD